MEKRLQLLLDAERYEQVRTEAERTGRSVAAVIREAIDLRFAADSSAERARAGAELLALAAVSEARSGRSPGEGPAELKSAYDADLVDRGPR